MAKLNKYLGTSILTQNGKMKKTSKKFGIKLFNFGIPAYKTGSGKLVCPFADTCIKFCYAQKGAYSWGNVKPAFEKRYELSQSAEFSFTLVNAVKAIKATHVRIHDSGDFYSPVYLDKWMQVAKQKADTVFYFYTKSVKMVKDYDRFKGLPGNVYPIFSFGGKQDHLIDKEVDTHAVIFDSLEALESAGYNDCSEYDIKVLESNKVGLIIH